jgi:membrane protease YdiL (CAAX protease family)
VTGPEGRASQDRSWILILVAAVALTIFYYATRADVIGVSAGTRGWTPMTARSLPYWAHFVGAAFLLGVGPVLAARLALGVRAADLGLGLGNVRMGGGLLAVGGPLAVVAGAIAAATPVMSAVYPLDPGAARASFARYAPLEFLYYGAWEVLFRGVLLFGLRERVGAAGANALQTALSVLAHFGRPWNETVAAIPAGLLFGAVDLKVGSVWYVAVIHWMVGVSMEWFILR